LFLRTCQDDRSSLDKYPPVGYNKNVRKIEGEGQRDGRATGDSFE
jgi:hypothetical protein